MLPMRLDVDLEALVPDAEPRVLLEAAQRFFIAEAREILEAISVEEGDAASVLTALFHPAAPPMTLEASTNGHVRLSADTLLVGSGYDASLRALAGGLAEELCLDWTTDATAGTPQDRALAWLAAEVAPRGEAHDDRRMLGRHRRVRYPGVRTPTLLGPRDDAWLSRVRERPSAGVDCFPWWGDGSVDAAFLRGRALTLLWHEVRYRPLLSEHEEELCESALEDLCAAFEAAPELDYPVEAWAEVSRLLDGRLPPPASAFERDARAAPPGIRGAIGYRRGAVEREVGAGFSLVLPGELAEEESEDGIWAGDLQRSVHVAGILADPGTPREALFEEAPPLEGEPLSVTSSSPDVEVRATCRMTADELVITAFAAAEGRACILTVIERGAPSDFARNVASSIRLRLAREEGEVEV